MQYRKRGISGAQHLPMGSGALIYRYKAIDLLGFALCQKILIVDYEQVSIAFGFAVPLICNDCLW